MCVEKIAWRRKGLHGHLVGRLRAGDGGIRLTGRDPVSAVDVALSIPLEAVQRVRVSLRRDEFLAGEQCVVLELADSEAILVRELGTPHRVHALARNLGALTSAPPLLAQGG